jgi:tyrosine-protein phosphatase YwqE
MKIAHKLVGSFIGVSLLTGVVGAISVAQSYKIAEMLAQAEAQNVAEVMAGSIAHHAGYKQRSKFIEPSQELQDFAKSLHELQKRDIEVVNRQKVIIADAIPDGIGTTFDHDQGNRPPA